MRAKKHDHKRWMNITRQSSGRPERKSRNLASFNRRIKLCPHSVYTFPPPFSVEENMHKFLSGNSLAVKPLNFNSVNECMYVY